MSTDGLPVADRFEVWREHILRTVEPVTITCDDPARFTARFSTMVLGPVRISAHTVSGLAGQRTPRLIRRSDPETFQLVLTMRGRATLAQDQRVAELGPSDLTLYHTSRPYRWLAGGHESSDALLMSFPGALLPFARHQVERLTATAFSGRDHIGGLLANALTTLADDGTTYRGPDAVRLGTVLMDLVTALLAHRLDAESVVSPASARRTLLMRIQAYIERDLTNPRLSPAAIAAAHNISIRTLHRLFTTENVTVAAWIRARRLDRCRRDLADPALAGRPVHATAARWGFSDAAGFTRAFRAAYGLNPVDYRAVHGRSNGNFSGPDELSRAAPLRATAPR